MIKQRHPRVAEMLGFHLDPSAFFCRSEALSRAVGRCWVGRSIVEEFGRPVLESEADPTEPKRGWQHRAARCLEERHLRRQVGPTLTDPTRALALTARATLIDPQPFRVWLCRRLFLPLPLAYAFAPSPVKGIYLAPHIHEHLRYTIMATALRTPSRIISSCLSTLR